MLPATMVGALVRGWRNRSSPRRAESKLLIPPIQDGIPIQDGHQLRLEVPSAVTKVPNPNTTARHSCPQELKTMELSDSDRPISFGSTSSSASSRDSHGSFGSRMTLVSNSHLGLFNQDKEAGAIKLELIPARPFSSSELQRDSPATGQQNVDEGSERQPRAPWKVDSNGAPKTTADSATSPKLLYVDRVVQEILETERTYVQDLKSIVEDYLDCIRDQTKLLMGTEERSALFGNIQDIYRFNSELLQDLENCENDPVAIAECFVSKSEEFHIYTQYCTNYPRSVAMLTECMRNKILAKFFRERQETLKHSLPLGSYLLKPVQRILKYHLLLHEIENHLDKDTEGYDVVLDAIDTMQRVAWHINDMKRKHEHAVRLQEIQSLLTNWKGPDLTSYGELVLEGTFRLQRAKNERTLFLFDKLLLITKKRDDTFTYKAHILCGNLMLVEVIPKEPLSFSVFHYKNPKLQHTVQAKSQQDKRLWVLHLKRLILENHAAKIPAKAKQAILEMDAVLLSTVKILKYVEQHVILLFLIFTHRNYPVCIYCFNICLPGARIAEYSQLYDQIVFRESPLKIQKDGWASSKASSLLRAASPSQVHHGSEDWLLHSTYSNGELADFCPPPEQDLRSRYPTFEINTKSTPRQLSAACSVPSLQTSEPLLDSMQRCSVVVSQPHKENACQGHLYNSLDRKGISAKSQPYHRSQSSSSVLINKSMDSINYPSEVGKQQLLSLHRSSRCESHQDLLTDIADSHQQGPEKLSNLTLQDSQKVLVVNRNVPLNAQIATQNYFSNFKEMDGDEDDYVEIKSEEDESELELAHNRRRKSDSKFVDADFSDNASSGNTSHSLNSPCTPKKQVNSKLGLSPFLTPYNDSDKLNDYLWRGPSPNQQNIVQSLREKFQCLSSSSFS
ncbi:pleckstrin homology domain-containing family G member 1 [Sapajus apella]|uniref:Pleckstrin homology domain-containing family G member 1 n=1 Tax=Sapajus apella TaxID=9515 RepID=A0A6J3GBA3_SAPAP|nr:pleckstrin homology domain-containing family G member 1 [Sapajus apella]